MQIQYGTHKARKTRKTRQNNKIHNIHVIIFSYLLFTINLFAKDLIKTKRLIYQMGIELRSLHITLFKWNRVSIIK